MNVEKLPVLPALSCLDSIRESLEANFDEKDHSLQTSLTRHKDYHHHNHRSCSPDNDIMSTSSFVYDTRRSTPTEDLSLPQSLQTDYPHVVVTSTETQEDNDSLRYSCMNNKQSHLKRRLFSPEEQLLQEKDGQTTVDMINGEEDVTATVLKSLPTGYTLGSGTTIIQEQVETIITTEEGVSDPEENSANNIHDNIQTARESSSLVSEVRQPRSSTHHRYQQNVLYDEDFEKDSPFSAILVDVEEAAIRVPFPELGVDIVDLNYRALFPQELESEVIRKESSLSSKIRLTDLTSWEENWLFRKKTKQPCSHINSYLTLCDLDFASQPLRMLIPNPCQVTQTLIGDEDVRDILDLSERNSVASLVFSSSDEEDKETVCQDSSKSKSLSSPRDKQPILQPSSLKSSQEVMTQGLITGKSDDHRHNNTNNPDNNNSKKSTVVVICANVKQHRGNNSTSHVSVNSREVVELREKMSSHDSTPLQSIVRNGEKGSNDIIIPKSQDGDNKTNHDNNYSRGSKKPSFVFSSNKAPLSATKACFTSSCMNQEKTRRDIRDTETSYSSFGSEVGTQVTLPAFIPLNKRMESSRSDPCFVIKPCGASVQTDILVQFCCRVKGSRPLGVAWFKGDTLLSNEDPNFRIFSSGNEFVLEIKSTQEGDSDTFSCVVYNGFGEQWADFNLIVKRVKERTTTVSLTTKPSVSHTHSLSSRRAHSLNFLI